MSCAERQESLVKGELLHGDDRWGHVERMMLSKLSWERSEALIGEMVEMTVVALKGTAEASRWTPLKNWTVTPQYSYTRNDSNIGFSDYERQIVSVTARRDRVTPKSKLPTVWIRSKTCKARCALLRCR